MSKHGITYLDDKQAEAEELAADCMFRLYSLLSNLLEDDELYGWGDMGPPDDIEFYHRVMQKRRGKE